MKIKVEKYKLNSNDKLVAKKGLFFFSPCTLPHCGCTKGYGAGFNLFGRGISIQFCK